MPAGTGDLSVGGDEDQLGLGVGEPQRRVEVVADVDAGEGAASSCTDAGVTVDHGGQGPGADRIQRRLVGRFVVRGAGDQQKGATGLAVGHEAQRRFRGGPAGDNKGIGQRAEGSGHGDGVAVGDLQQRG